MKTQNTVHTQPPMNSLVFSLKAGEPRAQGAPHPHPKAGATRRCPARVPPAGAGQDSVLQRTDWGSSHKEPVWCPAHTEERCGNRGKRLEEAENCLSCIMLWENASVLKSGPEGLPHFREHQGTDLSDGKRPNCESPECPSGKKSGSRCQESQA